MMIHRRLFFIGIVLITLSGCSFHKYSSVEVDGSGLPQSSACIAEIIECRVAERVPHAVGRSLKVSFLIDNSLKGETALVKVKGGKAEISAGRVRGLVFGAGLLLREIRYDDGCFRIQDGEYRFVPEKPFRQCYIARHFDNWYHRATSEEIIRYIEDMALWGINSIHMHLDYPMVDAATASPEDFAVFSKTSHAIASILRSLDLDLTTIGGENSAPGNMPEQFKAVPNKDPRRGDNTWNVCPSKPGATDYLLSLRQQSLDRYADIPLSGFVYWPYDEGGCACEECSPWGGNGYVKLMEKMSRKNMAMYPGALNLVSTWVFDDDDWEMFYKYLETQDWVDYLIVDSHEDFPRYPLEHPVPGGIPIVTFPEISMWGRYPWGGFGATALPNRLERLFRQVEGVVSGFQLYSEGIYEDINKIVVEGLYANPSKGSDDILEEYASYELPGIDTRDFKKFIHLLERTHKTRIEGRGLTKGNYFSNFIKEGDSLELEEKTSMAAEALELAKKLDSQILPSMKNCWRWRLLYLRAVIDNEVYSSREIHTLLADEAYEEICRMYHAEIQMDKVRSGIQPSGMTAPPVLIE